MYRHCKDYEIRYTDVDFKDELKLSSLLSFLEESACFSADELGFGYDVLKPKNVGFILVNWYVRFARPIKLKDRLTVHTWPIKPSKLSVLREFELYVGEEKVGVATSRWCVVNLADFSFLSPTVVIDPNIEYNDFRAVDFNAWKIPRFETENPVYEKSVSYSDYDHYDHVNNTRYGDLVLDAFSVEELKCKSLSSVRITYVRQCKYGDVVSLYRKDDGAGVWRVEGIAGGELRVQAELTFDE